MKTSKFTQAGIGHVVMLFIIVFVAVVGFAGWKVATMHKAADTATTVSSSTNAPDTISNKADLVQTNQALDSSGSDVNSSLNDDSLNADLNDML